MAQVGIREFDWKNMYFKSIWCDYNWYLVKNLDDIDKINPSKKYVIKPDMLFWKRWKYWLVGVNLDKEALKKWYLEKTKNPFILKENSWFLDTFIVEEFISHKWEYYISFEASREGDKINFSNFWWIDVEENWDKVKSITINTLEELKEIDLNKLLVEDNKIKNLIKSLRNFYKNYWFTYLEINPFCFDEITNEPILLDMVAKVDDQEFFRQKDNWWELEFPNTFWFKENPREKYIRELDSQTWASLKFKVLNENAYIWTLLAWGGGSLVITDTLWYMWFSNDIWNYWELSGNPTREFTKEYSKCLVEQMLEAKPKNSNKKYLIIAWAIANFTNIKNTFTWIIDIFKEKQKEILSQNIQVLVRRWWIQEKEWLEYFKNECEKLNINCIINDSNFYMTDILKEIK